MMKGLRKCVAPLMISVMLIVVFFFMDSQSSVSWTVGQLSKSIKSSEKGQLVCDGNLFDYKEDHPCLVQQIRGWVSGKILPAEGHIFNHNPPRLDGQFGQPSIVDNILGLKPAGQVKNPCTELDNAIVVSGISRSSCNGRLGNQLGILAMGLQLHIKYGVRMVINTIQEWELATTFEINQTCNFKESSFCMVVSKECELTIESKARIRIGLENTYFRWEKGVNGVDKVMAEYKNYNGTWAALHCPADVKVVATDYLNEFQSQMVFRNDVLQISKAVLQQLKGKHGCSNQQQCTPVSVHLRMGDYKDHIAQFNKRKPGGFVNLFSDTDYLPNAFHHVMEHYPNPMFYLLGENPKELQQYVDTGDLDFARSRIYIPSMMIEEISSDLLDHNKMKMIRKGIDLALISMADVSILTYGTYGVFGAILTKEKDIFYAKDHGTGNYTGVNFGIPRFTAIPWKYIKPKHKHFK